MMEEKARVHASDTAISRSIRRKTVFAFSVFILAGIGMVLGWRWLGAQPKKGGISQPLRSVLNINHEVNKRLVGTQHTAPSFPLSKAAGSLRLNGNIGMNRDFDTAKWVLKIANYTADGRPDTLRLSINDIKALPKTDVVYEFKCIEGWSQVTHWAGARFSDLIRKYHIRSADGKEIAAEGPDAWPAYTGMATPDGKYYVGIDMPSAMHPQTILSYEMSGKPLPLNQGAPIRLIIPVKYGVKHIKRIGTIYFSNTKPRDYWAERGYDYDAAL